ncbi:hypothetical protein NitYY0826_C1678 [Nitratiruptor sp. YY08-26]|uniref:damage-control phosphatase ARMT1 family protein n=1 Tax=unclassified Nitratiruptor TaxID=2624044 RepID=UPI001916B525|nr:MULTISPECIES: ARMT1-like domain-containing protein [unclassified Nitratiruptor]BCD62795.1 hypothetical protein NitYY0813_C1676 [Nitratiruptor sp. YY08-13]BCD66731.1 hypothetical protein NitYY0826_C1678 [Nitratiruptor sp. YY08-26]
MLLKPDCFVCLYNQALRVSKALECDEECADAIMQKSAGILASITPKQTPPEAAAILYPAISKVVGKEDLYSQKKLESIQKAQEYVPFVQEKIAQSPQRLDAALRASVAGNVIDFATEVMFDIQEEIAKIFEAPFAIDRKSEFIQKLQKAQKLLIIGDNVGEHLFDKILIEEIKKVLDIKIYYFVRGRPIINDVTLQEAKMVGLDRVCEVVDSGVDTPGFLYERANEQAKALFDGADLILAKGMGNFECMESYQDSRVYFLFKVKCSVVANRIGKNIGDLICATKEDL